MLEIFEQLQALLRGRKARSQECWNSSPVMTRERGREMPKAGAHSASAVNIARPGSDMIVADSECCPKSSAAEARTRARRVQTCRRTHLGLVFLVRSQERLAEALDRLGGQHGRVLSLVWTCLCIVVGADKL